MDGVLAVIWMFGGNFAPRNWVLCDGQLLAISQNTALFSLLGTTYGGDGRTTFQIPEMRGRVPMHKGIGPGLPSYSLGQKGGVADVLLNTTQIPQHSHPATTTTQIAASSITGEEATVNGNYIANHAGAFNEDPSTGVTLSGATSATTVGNAGGNLTHTNIQPYMAVNFVMCVIGIYPSRN